MQKRKTHQGIWLYGWHGVVAALQNPKRTVHQLLATENARSRLSEVVASDRISKVQVVKPDQIECVVGQEAVHQGIAAEVAPLPFVALEEAVLDASRPVVLLDQVTDPHNVGAILRSAAAFDAQAVILPDKHAPREGSVLAKAACGALEVVPMVRVANLVQAMESLKAIGFWCIGLDGYAEQSLMESKPGAASAFVFGAEGKGLRRLTRERCDLLVKLPMSPHMESLNVSNAVAVTLYEWYRGQG